MSNTNSMVRHLWVNQSKDTARSSNGNLWFTGRTLYSYRTPIAVLHDGGTEGQRVALVTTASYSVTTTGKHMPRHEDFPPNVPVFYVPSIGAVGRGSGVRVTPVDHDANVKHLFGAYEREAARMGRMREEPRDFHRANLGRLARGVRRYAEAFNLPDVTAPDVAATLEAIRTLRAEREAKLTPAVRAKRERERQRRAERKAEQERQAREYLEADNAAKLEMWRNGASAYLPHEARRDDRGGAYLRVRGARVETSLGAEVPVEHARRVFPLIARCRTSGKPFTPPEGHSVHLGHFTLDHVSEGGDIRAGCHLIHWPEIERVASALGLFQVVVGGKQAADCA